MAKVIKYKFLSCEVNQGTEDEPVYMDVVLEKFMPWNEVNEEIAKCEAHNGEYEIYDDGVEVSEPTQEERIKELEEALNMLLSGVTE